MTTQIAGITFRYSHTIGRDENSGIGFRNPWAMVRGAGDLIYVVNRAGDLRPDAKRVTMCTVGEEYLGEFARGSNMIGETEQVAFESTLFWPTSIALDQSGNVYFADEWLNRISIFTKEIVEGPF